MNDFIFSALANGEEFSIEELRQALGVKTTGEKKRVTRNLSYLVKKGTLERLKKGEFKNLNHTSDPSKKLRYVDIDHSEDEQELVGRYNKFKETKQLSGHEFKQVVLWNYENRTSVFHRVSQNGKKDGYLLLISEDDPQIKRVIRYVSNKAMGSDLTVFFRGAKDLTLLFPGVTWL
jgi:hypothetical protein